MTGVELDAVETGAPAAVGGGGELLDHRGEVGIVGDPVLDARGGRRVGRGEPGELRVGEHHRQRVGMRAGRHRGHEHGTPARDVEAGQRAVVGELGGEPGTVRVDPRGERREPGDVVVVRRGDLSLVHAAVGVRDRHRADEQQGRTPTRPGLEVPELRVRHGAVGIGERIPHRRHEDPVPQRHRADRTGREQVREGAHAANDRWLTVSTKCADTVYMTAATAGISTRDRLVDTRARLSRRRGCRRHRAAGDRPARRVSRTARRSATSPPSVRCSPRSRPRASATSTRASTPRSGCGRPTTTPWAGCGLRPTGTSTSPRANPGVFSLMFRSDLCDVADPEYATAGGVAFGQLVALVADAQARGLRPGVPPAELAGVVWATVHGLASLHLHGALVPTTGQADLDVLVDLATEFLIPTTN